MKSYGGQNYNYQILTAIYYFLAEGYDGFAIEGDDREDCLFYIGNELKVIGEAKHPQSKQKWSLKQLFFAGNRAGPLTQLWLRDKGFDKLLFFSSVPVESSITKGGQLDFINISRDDLNDILNETNNRLKLINSLNPNNFDQFLSKVNIMIIPLNRLEEMIIQVARTHEIATTWTKLSEFVGYLISD